jgi:VCBS repeat-containing protein
MSLAQVFSGFRLTRGRRLPPLVRGRHGAEGSAAAAGAGWAGGLSFVALILSALKEAWAADPDVTLFDHGTITYKDFEHGSFELVTKEAVPRHIVVDDPEQTVVLTKTGSSVSFAQTANDAARMEELQAHQQDVLANYAKEHGPPGSSTPPGETADPAAQPINFVEPDGPVPQHSLPALAVPASFLPDAPLIHSPLTLTLTSTLTLTLASSPVEVDTIAFDDFSATSGSFSANSFGSGVAPIFGIAGGAVGPVAIAGATYDVEKPGSYGILYLNSATGAYTYVPNNDAINALKAPTTDNFTITASDGLASASQTFTVDINGTDDASVISGVAVGSVVEAAAGAHGVASASGTLTDTDVDDPANTFTAVSSPHVSDHSYGSFTITTDGHWTYTLDDGNPAVQALNTSDTLTDTFTVTTIGGTPEVVSVTIQGSDDPAVVSGDTHGCVVEAGGVHNATHGVPTAIGLLTDTDVDDPSNTFVAVTSPQTSDHGYGSFALTADGHWTYTLDNGNCAVQALNVGQTLTDSFVVKTVDGTAQTVTITIEGSNDAAAISGDTRGCVVEPSRSCDPPPSASGTLTDRDVDNPDNTFAAVTRPQTSDHGYGSFTMTASGTWTYSLDEGNPAVKALNACGTLTDTFTVTTIDGTAQTVTVTIQGADDVGPHDFHRQASSSSFQFKDDADLQHPSVSAPSADPSAAAGPHDSWHGSSPEGGAPHPADAAPDAFHFPGHGDVADGPAAVSVALHASHYDLTA